MSTSTKTGRCLCGKIKYELKGDTANPLYKTVCHCVNCRRATGTAFLTASICPAGGLNITEGAEYQKTYIDNDVDSGTHLKRIFCSGCGTGLFAITPLRDDIISVLAGTLDDFGSWKPDTEQWTDFRAAFLEENVKCVAVDRVFGRAVTAKSTE